MAILPPLIVSGYDRRPAGMPIGGCLVGRAGAEKRGLVKRPADQLQADRQAGAGESARHGERRLSGQVERESQVEEGADQRDILSRPAWWSSPRSDGAAIGLVGVTRTSNDRHSSR